jgi:hypothetical protein
MDVIVLSLARLASLHAQGDVSPVASRQWLSGDGGWGSAEVPAQPLFLGTIISVDANSSVHVDAKDDGDGLVRSGQARVDEPQCAKACALSEQVRASSGCSVTGG